MALGANSYSSLAKVAGRVPRWANGGTFDATTNPTATVAESWIDEVSAMLNVALSENGFTIPIVQADALSMMNMFVSEEVASMVLGVHGSGRFADRGNKNRAAPARFNMMQNDIEKFLKRNEYGLRKLGVAGESSLAFIKMTEDADTTEPLIDRESMDWDKE